jgi:hypothetical protein
MLHQSIARWLSKDDSVPVNVRTSITHPAAGTPLLMTTLDLDL